MILAYGGVIVIPKLDEYKAKWHITSSQKIEPGLERIEKALQKVGHPEKRLKIIHVAGTNGKGSTIAFMDAILQAHHYSTAVFSSPAIVDIHDQIRINGQPITPEKLHVAFQQVANAQINNELTDFELLTVVAFIAVANEQPDYFLVECGMGGKEDSTNVVTPVVSVIPSIALDHEGFLGSTIAEIAQHKAGIIKENIPVVIGKLSDETLPVIQQKAKETFSKLYHFGTNFKVKDETFTNNMEVTLTNRQLQGPHQEQNAAVAIQALLASGVQLNKKQTEHGIQQAFLPFRFQQIHERVYIDGAHNPAAAQALALTIEKKWPNEKVDFTLGMLRTKDVKETMKILVPLANSFTFINFPHREAADAQLLMQLCPHPRKRVIDMKDILMELSKERETPLLICGSLYLLQQMNGYFK